MENNVANRSKWFRYSYWALWFNVISAIPGGVYLLGGAGSMPESFLDNTPFSSFTIPGAILLLVVGGSSLLAATARVLGWNIRYLLTFAAGVILMGWIVVEFAMIPQGWPLQLLYAIVSVPMIVGGWIGWRTGHARFSDNVAPATKAGRV